MFIEKLELHGFKSFVTRTEVPLSPGITAIVGPNGCGKSNISDAFRWVLGEQNVRNIRGERIQDVIFKGTRRVKPMGMAEVSLSINNDRGHLPTEYGNVGIARRIYRSGDSEFSINKMGCRLKDIRDLFSGTGMGSHGYAVIERSMVDEVLSEKDDARRFLFEEASGIIRYKQRRREAQRKLEGVEQDLTRIEDMIREIEREVRSLARQAGRVRRWRRIKREHDRFEIRSAHETWSVLRDRSQSSELLRRERQGRKDELGSKISVLEARHETERQQLLQVSESVEATQRAVHQAGRRLAEAHEEMSILATRNDAWSREEADLVTRLDRDRRRLTQIEAEKHELAPRRERLESEVGDARVTAEEANRIRAAAEQELRATRDRLREAQQTSLHLVTSFSETQRELKSQRKRREELQERLDALRRHLEAFSDRERKVEEGLESVGARLEEVSTRIDERVRERSQVVAELAEIGERRDALSRELSDQGHRRAGLESRLAVLQEQHERHEGFDAAVRWILQNQGPEDGLLGVVGEKVRLRTEGAALGAALLGDRISWVIVRDEDTALTMIDLLRRQSLGGVTFFPMAEAGGDARAAAPEILELFDADDDVVPFLHYLAEDARIARSFTEARNHQDEGRWRHITPDGLLIERDGAIRLSGGRTQESEILSREQEIPHLREQVDVATREIERIQTEDTQLNARESELKDSITMREEELSDLEQRRAEAGEERSSLRTELSMLREEHTRLAAEQESLETEIVRLTEDVDRLQGQVLRSEEDSTHAQAAFEDVRKAAEELEETKDVRVREATQREMEQLRLENELKELTTTLDRLESEETERRQSVEETSRVVESRREEAEASAARITEIQGQLEGLRAEERRAQNEHDEARASHSRGQERINELEHELKAHRATLNDLVQELHAEDMERVQAESEAEQVRRIVQENHSVDLAEWSPPKEGEEDYSEEEEHLSPEERTARISELRQRLDSMGNLNFLAEEEYETHKERLEFHQKQESDLRKAREDLLDVIRQINETAGEMFRTTFEQVQAIFHDVFTQLFPGGEASLRLEGDDPLEGDVEISARPRGKRLESIRLLSTGERSLTAIAILFSLYLIKPSPICLLDEVDAPLDDANLDRFLEMLKKLSERTQFIMITHNKKTMQVAQNIFGVTMEEPGISKIVSVRFQDGDLKIDSPGAAESFTVAEKPVVS